MSTKSKVRWFSAVALIATISTGVGLSTQRVRADDEAPGRMLTIHEGGTDSLLVYRIVDKKTGKQYLTTNSGGIIELK